MTTHIKFATMLLSLSPIAVSAQSLADPTRPAIASLYSDAKSSGNALDSHTATPAVLANKGLQTIIISPNRRAAMINGQVLEQGEKSGAVTLLEVNEREVVLQSANGKKVLQLFPSVEMTNFQSKGLSKINRPTVLHQDEAAAQEEK